MEITINGNEKPSQDKPRIRKEWLDFLRGFAMLLVIWGHVGPKYRLFSVITGPFKMSLFFAITGYLFSDRNGDAKVFFLKLFRTIVIPWIVLSLIWLKPIYAIIIGRPNRITSYLVQFVSGKTFWYIPCILIAETLFFQKCMEVFHCFLTKFLVKLT